MEKDILFKGWFTYTDSGGRHRRWAFKQPVEDLGAEQGWELFDDGPQDGDERLHVRKVVGDRFSAERFREVFRFELPAWRPPRREDPKLIKTLEGIAREISALAAATRASVAQEKLASDVPGGGDAKTKEEVPCNQFLRLKFDGEYNNGEPYKDFELLVDVPEIPITRVQGLTPMHAAKGDVLREESDDQLTPFELRRNGRRIGDPEWWQVRHLFEGLKGERIGHVDPDVREAKRLFPLGPKRMWKEATTWGDPELGFIAKGVFRASESVAGTMIRLGDLIVHAYEEKSFSLFFCGAVTRLPRAEMSAFAKQVTTLRFLGSSYRGDTKSAREELREYLRRAGRRGRDDTSKILIVRPLVSPVSSPIHANNDAEAIFELLYQVSRGESEPVI